MLANLESERLESAAMRRVEWLIDRGIIEPEKRGRDPRAAQPEIGKAGTRAASDLGRTSGSV